MKDSFKKAIQFTLLGIIPMTVYLGCVKLGFINNESLLIMIPSVLLWLCIPLAIIFSIIGLVKYFKIPS